MKNKLIVFIYVLTCFLPTFAQETTLQLPTNDNTSSFNVTKNNGSSVFKVDGRGRITGDGSGLSNLRALVGTRGGNNYHHIVSNYGYYDKVKEIPFYVPSSRVCFVIASGIVDWESKGWDVFLSSIIMDRNPNGSWSTETEFYSYLNLLTDYNCADSSDQYTSFAHHRTIGW